jgi:hypothetical protein
MWYYTDNGERHGPISQPGIKSLYAQHSITPDTLVWQEGMEDWQPLHATPLANDLQIALPDGDSWEKCAFSGDRCRRSQMVQIDGWWIGFEHKDDAVEFLKQGGTLPVGEIDNPFKGNTDLGHLITSSWRLLAPCLPSAIALHLAVWIPGNLAISYMDTFHFSENEVYRSFQFNGWVQSLWGNLAVGGILYMLCQQILGRPCTFGNAVGAAFSNWGRLWVASFISGLMMIVGFLLLIIPGLIVLVRTTFANSAAVDAQMSGSSAVQESWDVSKGSFWLIFGYILIVGIGCTAPTVLFSALSSFIPILEHWALNGVISSIVELPLIYLIAFNLVFYRELKARPPGQLIRM